MQGRYCGTVGEKIATGNYVDAVLVCMWVKFFSSPRNVKLDAQL